MLNDKMIRVPEPLYKLMLQANAIIYVQLAIGSVCDKDIAEYKRLEAEYESWQKELYANREEGV